MTVIGIDADTRRVAYAVISHSGQLQAVSTIPREARAGFVDSAYDARLTSLMRKAQDAGAMILVEDTWVSETDTRNVTTVKRLTEVIGEIRARARMYSVPVDTVDPATWRSETIGVLTDRPTSKAAARDWVMRHYKVTPTEHECEAICIAEYGRKMWTTTAEWPVGEIR